MNYLLNFVDDSRSKTGVLVDELPDGRFPIWVTQIARIYEASFGDRPLILIEPREAISVDQGARLHQVVSQTLKQSAILIADRLPPKGRGTLVRLRVPHVIGNRTVFAPELGLHYQGLPKPAQTPTVIRPKLTSLAVRLSAYYLLHHEELKDGWTLSQWHETLKSSLRYSLSSLSRAFTQLMQHNLVEITPLGVSKRIHFLEPTHVWRVLANSAPDMVSKRIRVSSLPSEKFRDQYLLSGESALAAMSDLNEPTEQTIALASIIWRAWQNQAVPAQPNKPAVLVEVWEGGSPTFPRNDRFPECIDPISLALSLRHEVDSRIHIALQEALSIVGLDAEVLWSQK